MKVLEKEDQKNKVTDLVTDLVTLLECQQKPKNKTKQNKTKTKEHSRHYKTQVFVAVCDSYEASLTRKMNNQTKKVWPHCSTKLL